MTIDAAILEGLHDDASSSSPNVLASNWMSGLRTQEGIKENRLQYWGNDPSILSTHSSPGHFAAGSGLEIYSSSIIPSIESAEHEVIFVTCFWAASASLNHLSSALIQLSNRALSRRQDASKIRVRLCLSSRSFFQKLFHPSSPSGYNYPPTQWVSKLGLPPPEALQGLDLEIKSIFILPFSVMHPKFVIIDRNRALLPSCNLSHEVWLEGCISLTGPIVSSLLQFWHFSWVGGDFLPLPLSPLSVASTPSFPTTLLPSPHHRSPLFRPFGTAPAPPPTPLNTMLLHLIHTARTSILFFTPNFTCPSVLSASIAALATGVSITIITNRRMMVVEQLLTAGTITELCIWQLVRQYQALKATKDRSSAGEVDEAAWPELGKLQVGFFISSHRPEGLKKSHLKCTIIDDSLVVLGSGNMDRASWFTSQELGVAIEGREIVRDVRTQLDARLEGKFEKYFGW